MSIEPDLILCGKRYVLLEKAELLLAHNKDRVATPAAALESCITALEKDINDERRFRLDWQEATTRRIEKLEKDLGVVDDMLTDEFLSNAMAKQEKAK